MKHTKMVVLDMAGTTINEKNVVYKTLHKAIKNAGVAVTLNTVLAYGAGKEKHQAIKDVLAHLNEANKSSSAIFEDFKILLDEAYKTLEVSPINGVEKTILNLREKGIIVVLNTGYNRKVATGLLEKMQWKKGQHFDALITADDVEKGRPNPDMILKAMQLFNIDDPATVLKAGDSAIDIEEGKNAKCGITVGVLSGAQTKEQLEKEHPTYILDSLATLETVL
ncbi:phosphonatase-like hydrolase [Polaribacter batillariae]|uniref:Phosphonatase-like hydrolase n=1 Tax=Polaribacter batillariae TaxID=2808900 RepID=A0ABX7SSJ0_9FLAO|nr:phosphonatase-like hydrolase [Polaribacter batillariae]QTD36300.1 phosphonatase-like hydrolase [Polaribacter batillariae]